MKKEVLRISVFVLIVTALSSCSAIFTVRVNDGQRANKNLDQKVCMVSNVALIADNTNVH